MVFASVSSAVHVVDLKYTPYPPFATIPWSFTSMSTYLISTDLYLSAISISQDVNIRRSIKQIPVRESKFFGDVGTAEMEQELQNRISKISREQEEALKEKAGVKYSMSEEDVKEYVEELVEEMRKVRQQKESRS